MLRKYVHCDYHATKECFDEAKTDDGVEPGVEHHGFSGVSEHK
jgi:hypothetical protein